MTNSNQMLQYASRNRQLATQIRGQAKTMSRDALRATAIKQAEKLEAEATGLETVIRATSYRPERNGKP